MEASEGRAKRALLLGGAGFIGRHVAAALRADGFELWVGSRDPSRHEGKMGSDGMRKIRFERMLAVADWEPMLDGIDVAINCVGILRERFGESYEAVHRDAPAALARACAKRGVRLIHVSALSLREGDKSGFLSSKLAGEKAIAASGADYCVARPSLLDGEGGFGATWLRALSRSPVQLVPRGATGRIAAMSCVDLGVAIAKLAAMPSLGNWREAEMGGARGYGYAEYLRELRSDYARSPAWQIMIPDWMARLGAHMCDLVHFSPFSYGHWLLLQRDNLPGHNRLEEILGREALAITKAGQARQAKLGDADGAQPRAAGVAS